MIYEELWRILAACLLTGAIVCYALKVKQRSVLAPGISACLPGQAPTSPARAVLCCAVLGWAGLG